MEHQILLNYLILFNCLIIVNGFNEFGFLQPSFKPIFSMKIDPNKYVKLDPTPGNHSNERISDIMAASILFKSATGDFGPNQKEKYEEEYAKLQKLFDGVGSALLSMGKSQNQKTNKQMNDKANKVKTRPRPRHPFDFMLGRRNDD